MVSAPGIYYPLLHHLSFSDTTNTRIVVVVMGGIYLVVVLGTYLMALRVRFTCMASFQREPCSLNTMEGGEKNEYLGRIKNKKHNAGQLGS